MSARSDVQEQERPIDRAFARWVQKRCGSALLGRAALAVSRAEGQGHACVALADDEDFSAQDIAALRSHAWVGDGAGREPFVLDHAQRFYTLRNWRHEAVLGAGLLARASHATKAVDNLARDVAQLFGVEDVAATRWQRAAVALAVGAKLLVLTGGPGTGKTATALRILLMLLRHAAACGLPERPVIALAAPTGKAAQRLAQTLAVGKQRLSEGLPADSAFHSLLDAVPHTEAGTVHRRLLGYRPAENTFARNENDPIAADIVLVDEASMVDLALMRALVAAMRAESVLILLGDPGQLAAVEAGSVLDDVVASVPCNALTQANVRSLKGVIEPLPEISNARSPLTGQVITLRHVWRAGNALQRALEALRSGDQAGLDAALAENDALRLHPCDRAAALRTRVAAWLNRHAASHAAIFAPGVAPETALAQLRQLQVLCALRDGAFGAQGLNELLERELGARHGFDAAPLWYNGRPILVVHNDYARELFNGDIGIALQGPEGLRVWFEVRNRDGSIGLRSFSPRALPEHATAWAITIHRSQGSEYGDVAVVLPPDPAHRILSRELLYTAVSRATRSAEIWTTPESLHAAASRPIKRIGGLRERLG
jgi:exodeoxyribonuclease V alpha subunit